MIIEKLSKALVAVVVAPAALVADLATLPSSAHDGRGPFDRTAMMLKAAGKNVRDVVSR